MGGDPVNFYAFEERFFVSDIEQLTELLMERAKSDVL